MAFFDKKDTVTVSPEVAACEQKLAELERSRIEKVLQIGQIFLNNNKEEELVGTVYEGTAKAVSIILKEKEFQEKRMLAVQGKRKCETCGNILVLDSAFCNKCGKKLEPLFAEEMKKQNICPKCGNTYGEDAMFCTSCGQKLG